MNMNLPGELTSNSFYRHGSTVDDQPPSPVPSEALPEYVTDIGHGPIPPSSNLPPSYRTPRPTQPLTFTFSAFDSETMLLMPPQTSADLSPLYNITVSLNLNPFVPLSYVTTVRRGATQAGDVVGSFELSINLKRTFVTVGNVTRKLADVMWCMHGSSERYWDWFISDVNLRWDCRLTLDDGSPMCVCYLAPSSDQVATFVPPPLDAIPPGPAAVLTVFPDGWEWFDQILLSALVIERKRGLEV